MSMREAMRAAFTKSPDSVVVRTAKGELTEQGNPRYVLGPSPYLPFRSFRIEYAPKRYPSNPDTQVVSARNMMNREWREGGMWLNNRLKNPDTGELVRRITDWSSDTHQIRTAEIARTLGLKRRNSVNKARQGLNIGKPLDPDTNLYDFTTEELLQLMVGSLALQLALYRKDKRVK